MLVISLTEYETCTRDSLELQWHLDCKSRQLRQVQNQIFKIEAVSRRIQEDVDFMKKHSPLLEEKLNLEGEAVKDVLLAYEKVSTNHTEKKNHKDTYPFRAALFWHCQSILNFVDKD